MNIFLSEYACTLPLSEAKPNATSWIPDAIWHRILSISDVAVFKVLPDAITQNTSLWRTWYDSESPELLDVPVIGCRLSAFQKLCIIKVFREDRTLIAANSYIASILGSTVLGFPPLSLEKAFDESSPSCPLICLLSIGSDPTRLIEDLARRMKVKLHGVSMGQGQEALARKQLDVALAEGDWVLLQNTHLGLSLLPEVETALVSLEHTTTSFRLWMTTEPHPLFPTSLLQMGIKLTCDAPVGVRASLRTSYQWVNQDMLDAIPSQEWRQILFVTCFLHSILQERRKFGPIGWNVPYEFNRSDLAACIHFLQSHLLELDASRPAIPAWETIRYMVGRIQYGGRITDMFDQLLMDTYVQQYYHQNVLVGQHELFRQPKPGGFSYVVPNASDVDVYRDGIDKMPDSEGPEIFGLHTNADISCRTRQVQATMSVLQEIIPKRRSSSKAGVPDDNMERLAADLLNTCPPIFDQEVVTNQLQTLLGGAMQPLTIHLRQEIDCLNQVIKLANSTLHSLRLAASGLIASNSTIDESLQAVREGKTPAEWLKCSWSTPSLTTWFGELLQRHEQLLSWLERGRPKAFWLAGFFNPQGFLTAIKQEVARKHATDNWALEDVVLTSEVVHPAKDAEDVRDMPSEGVYIYGMYLEGCAWCRKHNHLIECEPKKMFDPLPILHITAVQAKDRKKMHVFDAPCYRVRTRTSNNYITTISLRSEEDKAKWILRGVAVLASIA